MFFSVVLKSCSFFFYEQISPIQSLVFQMGRKWVMGVISQLEDGHFYLEDLSASVEIDLTTAISFFFKAKFDNISCI